jgi:DNA-binding SARP family transcriptional activator/tetratricopeptide (TPR) repeat protein
MRFNLLGPVTVTTGGDPLVLPPGIPRDLLVFLLLNANRAVSGEQLAGAVWGDDRPVAFAAGLRNHVSRLRRQLGPVAGARIRTVAPGYLAEVGEGELDEQVFLDGCRRGLQALQAGEVAAAADGLARALDLWRGEPFAELTASADVQLFQLQAQHLRETRLLALEGRVEADLRLGRHRELVPEIRALVAAHPLREALHGQLMLALFRAGRQAEALEVYRALRGTLVEELGLEPSSAVAELHRRILAGDPALATPQPPPGAPAELAAPGRAPAAARPPAESASAPASATGPAAPLGARFQLPVDTRVFTGRARELAELARLALRAPEGDGSGMVVISAIDGMPGVGKSALAIHAAHRVRGCFPDGQLFVDLRGHTPGVEPMSAGDALDWLLRSLGVPQQLIPQDLAERAAFYRERLSGTATLVLLDNAASAEQVRPLIPGLPGCLVVITSRRRLGLGDAHTFTLGVLSEDEAIALLHKVAGPGRVREGDPAASELVALCGRLPLALRITAARLRHHRSLGVADVVAQLRDECSRLDYLRDEERSLTAVLDLSYQELPEPERRLFRLLGLVPGPDVDPHAAAALAGTGRAGAERLLESLLDHALLVQHTPGRYRFHDLTRLRAQGLLADDPAGRREAALRGLLDHYQSTADAADRLLARRTRPGLPPAAAGPGDTTAASELTDQATALAWLRLERDNLVAAAGRLDPRVHPARVIALTAALGAFLQLEGPWSQAAVLHAAAVDLARERGDRLAEANALCESGRLHLMAGDLPDAIAPLESALTIYQELSEPDGEANARWELARVRLMMGDCQAATGLLERALTLYQKRGSRIGEAQTLQELGSVGRITADYADSTGYFERALAVFRELDNRIGAAQATWDLASVRFLTSDFAVAAELYRQALVMFLELGNRRGEAYSLSGLGRLRRVSGQYPEACDLHGRALEMFQGIGDRHGEAYALLELGRIRLSTGDHPSASDFGERSLALYQHLGIRPGAADALHGIGCVRHATGDRRAASELFERALAVYREVGDPQGEAVVLTSMAALAADSADPGADPAAGAGAALPLYERAARLAREVRSPLDEARALEGAARCAASIGDRTRALAGIRRAVALYQGTGAAGAEAAAEFLASLARP